MSVKILAISTDYSVNDYRTKNNLYGGIGYYRLYRPYEELRRQYPEYEIDILNRELVDMEKEYKGDDFFPNLIQKYDIIITKAVDNAPACSMITFLCDHFKKKLVVDLDDNYFKVTPDQPAYKWYHPGGEKRGIVSAYLSFASALIVSTEPLQRYYQERVKKVYNKDIPVFLMPNFNRIEDWNFKLAKKEKDKIVIGWAGSTTHDADLQLVIPSINKLMGEYPNLHLELCGGITKEKAPNIFQYFDDMDRVAMIGGTQAWEGYPEMMCKKRWDIGIAPLVNNEFTRGKSHIKWMEYAMCKLPCVASKVYPYYKGINGLKTIEDGKTGMLAIDNLDFYKKLKILIDDPELRVRMGLNAYDQVAYNWQWSKNIYLLNDIIQKICCLTK